MAPIDSVSMKRIAFSMLSTGGFNGSHGLVGDAAGPMGANGVVNPPESQWGHGFQRIGAYLAGPTPLPPLAVTRREEWDGPVHILPVRLSRVYIRLWNPRTPLDPSAPLWPLMTPSQRQHIAPSKFHRGTVGALGLCRPLRPYATL